MIYIVLVCAIVLGGIAALASFVAAIVQAVRTRWKSAAAWAVLMVFLLVAVAGTGVWVVANGASAAMGFAQRKAKEIEAQAKIDVQARTEARSAPLLELTPAALRQGINSEFWTIDSQGEMEGARTPLRFPYSMRWPADSDTGNLSYNGHKGKVFPFGEQSLLHGVVSYCFDGKMFLCHQRDGGGERWILYMFDDDTQKTFASEDDLIKAAKAAKFDGPPVLRSVKEQYEDYWK